jgi:hypothetical protein
LAVAVGVLKTEYLARRRGWIFDTLRYEKGGPYLGPQPTNAEIRFGAIEFNPASRNQAQEYIELVNPNSYAVDLSGWTIGGAVDFTLRPGTVIPSNSVLYLSPDVTAFRARTSGPRGGQGLFVQGNYRRQLSAWGELLRLSDVQGRPVQSTNYTGNPTLAQQYLRITEIMYHPAPPPPGLMTNADAFEYLELRNLGPVTLDLAGIRFTAGIEFDFTGSAVPTLGPGQRVLVVKNQAAFSSRYGNGRPIAGQYSGALGNEGETLRLEDASGEKILEFAYDPRWYRVTDGAGFSLVIQDDEGPFEWWALKESWRPSSAEGGSPGAEDAPAVAVAAVRVNEVLSRTDPPVVDAVELYNPSPNPVNLRGWFLTDDFGTPKKFRVGTDVILPPGGYRVFDEHDFNAQPASPNSFAFSSQGDEVYLFSGDANTNLTGYFHGFQFGASDLGVSFGRHVISTGEERFVAQSGYTPNGPNSGPRIGPVVIAEILFHPPELSNGQDNVTDEYIVLRNLTAGPVRLFDPAQPANTWQMGGAILFHFPTNATLPAQGMLVVVSFDPADTVSSNGFRARYGLPADVPLFGPYAGKLDNSGETIELLRPGVPEAGVTPYVLVERIQYSDSAPWPSGADGTGASLQRRSLGAFGDDPANWFAAAPALAETSPGVTPPRIVSHPASQVGLLSQRVNFQVMATGSDPLRYQWQHHGANLPDGTNAILALSNLRSDQAGEYGVTVYNGAGTVQSSNATLTLTLPAYLISSPQSVRVRGSTNLADYGSTTNRSATFSVTAVGSGELRYQWRFKGNDLPGENAPTLTIPSIDLSKDGLYDVMVTDASGTIASPPARLTVLLSPVLVRVPLSQSVVSNGSFTTSVIIRGNPPPFYYRWLEATATRALVSSPEMTNFFSYGPITNVIGRAWRIVVTNEANMVATAINTFFITALPDIDVDGLPDEWERTYGLDPADPNDRDLDMDGDGVSNRAEYLSGTAPNDAQSYLKVDQSRTSDATLIHFNAAAFLTYSVQYRDSLESGAWIKLADVQAAATSRLETVVDPEVRPQRYYRLVTPRLP